MFSKLWGTKAKSLEVVYFLKRSKKILKNQKDDKVKKYQKGKNIKNQEGQTVKKDRKVKKSKGQKGQKITND